MQYVYDASPSHMWQQQLMELLEAGHALQHV
jgi:hypothetical protein